MPTKIAFIETPYVFFPRLINVYTPNPGPLAVAAYLEREGHECHILDTIALDWGWAEIEAWLRRERPDVVGISCVTKNAYLALSIAQLAKQVLPDVVTIAGGPHVSLCPELTLRICPELDFAVVGEGERTAAELLRALEDKADDQRLAAIPGLAFLRGETYHCGPVRELIEDLDSLPMPAYHLVPMQAYSMPFFGPGGMGAGFSRGCTFSCSFCSEQIQWQQVWRGRSGRWMAEELELLVEKYGRVGYWMNDPSFLHTPERTEEFIQQMQPRKLPIRFHMQVRADHVIRDRALLPGLASIGCKMAMLGVETHQQHQLDAWNKGQELPQVQQAADIIAASGIPILMTCLIWGNWQDDAGELRKLVSWAYEIGGFFLAHDLMVPWPGTPYFEQMRQLGRIEVWDWRKYDFDHAIMPTQHLSRSQLEALNVYPFLTWWFNPKRFARAMVQEDRRRMVKWQVTIPGKVARHELKQSLARRTRLNPIERRAERIYQRHLEVLGVTEGSGGTPIGRAAF